jgi:hypothetical protein
MLSRRDLMQSGLALSAAASVFRPGIALAVPAAFDRFVFDNRFADSILLARRAAERGAVLWETAGDMTALWCDYLKDRWTASPVSLAGVTTRDGLFVMETLAADFRLRTMHCSELLAPEAGERKIPLYAWIIAPRSAAAA